MQKKLIQDCAFTTNNFLIKADVAKKGEEYFCPSCKDKLILKKSGKTGIGSKRPHFAHSNTFSNCTGESYLHITSKQLLSELIKDHINKKLPLNMAWECDYCHDKHEGNLLKKCFEIQNEYYMDVCRPDIALFDEKGSVFAVIEIVVTHRPEDIVTEYYKNNNIILIQIELNSENDLNNIYEKIKTPSIVDCCFNPKCQHCGKYMTKRKLIITNTNCYRCGNLMNACYIMTINGHITPAGFTKDEIVIARQNNVLLEMRFSKTTNTKYLANICPRCKAFIGEWFLFDNIIIESYNDENIPKYIGYNCDKCNRIADVHDTFLIHT